MRTPIATTLEKEGIKTRSAILICAVALFAFIWAFPYRKARGPMSELRPAVAVEVRGEVKRPGIYVLSGASATVGAAAARAGAGPKIPGSLARIELVSGQSIEVVGKKKGAAIQVGRMRGAALLAFGLKLDLNSAPLGDLLLVPHLSPRIAEAIIERRSRKPFTNVADLLEIRGVGPKTLQKLGGCLEVSSKPEEAKK